MESKDIVLLAVTLVILAEVSYLLAKLPKTSIKSKDRAILVDTSVLMDGRIVSVAATGFIGGTLVIPRSVIGELQLLADGSDSDKRARARFGLDVMTQLQKLDTVSVELLQDGSRASEGVDERLLTLAKQHRAAICTLDYNLNKVAAVEGIAVLNINELAQSVRMSYLPGDQIVLELLQKGQDAHQAVGYLADGTMVVVEQSSAYIGKTVHVEVIRSLQTAAGKMMFAKRIDDRKAAPAAATKPLGAQRKSSELPQAVVTKKAASKPRHHPAKAKQGEKVANPEKVAQKPPQSRPAHLHRRRPTQTDREAAFIALVDKQE